MIKLKLLNGIKIRKTHRCALTKKYTKDISQTHRKLSQNLAPPKISVATCANVAQAGISKSLFDKSASIFTCASSSLINLLYFLTIFELKNTTISSAQTRTNHFHVIIETVIHHIFFVKFSLFYSLSLSICDRSLSLANATRHIYAISP